MSKIINPARHLPKAPPRVKANGIVDGRCLRRKYATAQDNSRASYLRNKNTTWLRTKFRRLGITPEEFDRRAEEQEYCCAICGGFATPGVNGAWRELSVDHDHRCCPASKAGQRPCGKCTRGLLCDKCNQLLGLAGDSVEVLRAAIVYLMNGGFRGGTSAEN